MLLDPLPRISQEHYQVNMAKWDRHICNILHVFIVRYTPDTWWEIKSQIRSWSHLVLRWVYDPSNYQLSSRFRGFVLGAL